MSGVTAALAREAKISSRLGDPQVLEIASRSVPVDVLDSPEAVAALTSAIPLSDSRYLSDPPAALGLLAELEARLGTVIRDEKVGRATRRTFGAALALLRSKGAA